MMRRDIVSLLEYIGVISMQTSKTFSLEIEKMAKEKNLTHMDAVVEYCRIKGIEATKCFNDADWNREWNNLEQLIDTFETMSASEDEAIRAKGHIETAIKHLERGIKRWGGL